MLINQVIILINYLLIITANLHLKNESLFYGGEVCLWAEYTDDSDILTRLWFAASASRNYAISRNFVQLLLITVT